MLYFRFAICLTLGLIGVSVVLKTVIDVLFTDWDAYADFKRFIASFSHKHRQRYVLLDEQGGRVPRLATRALIIDRPKVSRAQQFLAPPEPLDPTVQIAPPPTLTVSP